MVLGRFLFVTEIPQPETSAAKLHFYAEISRFGHLSSILIADGGRTEPAKVTSERKICSMSFSSIAWSTSAPFCILYKGNVKDQYGSFTTPLSLLEILGKCRC